MHEGRDFTARAGRQERSVDLARADGGGRLQVEGDALLVERDLALLGIGGEGVFIEDKACHETAFFR